MASIKVKFRPATIADHEGTVYYQIIHDRKVRQLYTDYRVLSAEWSKSRSMVATTHKSERKAIVNAIRDCIRLDVERLTKIDRKLDGKGLTYTADDIIDEFNRSTLTNTPFSTSWKTSLPNSSRLAKSERRRHTNRRSTVSKSSVKTRI